MSLYDDRRRAFVLWSGFAVLVIAIAFAFSIWLTIIVALFFLAALWIARSIWSTPDEPYTNIRKACITLLTLITPYYVAPRYIAGFYNNVLVPVIEQLTSVQLPSMDLSAPSYWPFIFILFAIGLVLWSLPDRTIMRPVVPPNAIEKDGQFEQDLVSFVELWEHRLGTIDRATNWSNRDFVPLDAEVEVHSLVKNQRSVGDLITILREDKTDQPILILGEPGSGKSVALRRLCRELIKETPETKRLPLYINLRNWTSTVAWSDANPPTTAELRDYVHAYVHREADDLFADRFLKAHFEEMLQRGIIFFIFDSFDEIPAVMDQPENSWVIAALSDVIGKFLRGAHASRGIVASRYFKRPTDQLEAGSIYRIKPFDDVRIWRVLERVGVRTASQIREVFQKRSDLIAAASNPLIANLLAMFVREHGGEWPSSKLILFDHYIMRQLSDPSVVSRMTSRNLTFELCIDTTIAVATVMTESDTHGLEIPMDRLTWKVPDLPVTDTLHILKFARLGRLSADYVGHFSFAHRRFQEFFVVVGMIQKGTTADKAAIIVDTRYRDINALYCEVAESGATNEVALHCWGIIKDSRYKPEKEVAAIQALRFLTEAFRSRRDFTERFLSDLKEDISRELTRRISLRPLAAKFSCEAIALLDDARAADVFPEALAYKSAWVRETAFKSCRHLVIISEDMKTAATILICRYRYEHALGFSLLRHHRELKFSLSISDGFRSVKHMEAAWVLDVWIALISMFGLVVLSPVVAIVTAAELSVMNYATNKVDTDEFLKAWRWVAFFISAAILGVLVLLMQALAFAFSVPELPPRSFFFPWAHKFKSLGVSDSGFLQNVYVGSVWVCLSGVFIPVVPFLVRKWVARDTIVARFFGAIQRLKPGRAQTAETGVGASPKRQQSANIRRMGLVDVIFAIEKLIQNIWKDRAAILTILLVVSSVITICYSAWLLLGLKIIVLVVASVVGVGIVVGTVRIAMQKFRDDRADKKIMDSCKVASVMRRETIEEMLDLLKGREARLKFVRTLAINHVAVVGCWRSGRLPFVGNDPVSDELARLEERWLRLDT